MGRKKQPADKLGAIRNPDGYWINSSVFSEEAAHFQKYGTYCDFAEGSSGFVDYWSEQLRRITEGHTVGGVRITGPHYQYLNFTPIKRSKEENNVGVGTSKVRDFPDFWDYDYNYFHSIEIARKGISEEDYLKLNMEVKPTCLLGGHHMIVAKTRRRGYSYKGSVLALNAYQTVRDSLTLLAAYEKKFLHPKGVLTMFNLGLGFLDANTGWAKRREYADRLEHKKASYKKFRPGSGTPAEVGFLSEMMALTFKDNPDASRGGDAHLVLMDETGAWPGLEQAYKVLQPLCEDGKYISGQIVLFGTGGSMESGSVDFAKMFYEPASYNLLAFENIWDEEAEGDTCGFYVPDYKNKVGYIDRQGNSKEDEARDFENRRREVMLAAGKKDAYNQHIQEFSFCPAEAFLITGDNKFPVRELRMHRLWLEKTQKFKGVPVFLRYANGEASYEVDLKGSLSPLYRYGGTPKDTTGAAVMYKKPEKGKKYKGGYDTIQQDEGSSLAAWQIYVDNPLGNDHGEIVMSFYGRGRGPDDCDEKLMIAALLYNNADIMHENMFRSTKNNFKMWGKDFLLSSQPDMVIKNTIKDSKVEREFGVHMTDRIKLEACLIGSRRLEEVVGYEEDGTPIMYLNTIRDIRLIEELIRFNTTGNFDAVMAFLMWCISDEESRLLSVVSNTNTKGIGTQFEELRNYRRVHGSLF